MASLYCIKGILILDNDGERILCKYFDEAYPTLKEQRAFETNLFQKTQRANAEIIMFEGITCVYRSNVDLYFYVFGSSNENELILASVLNSFYDAVSITLRENVEKAALFDCFGQILLIVDELVDGGIIMQTDAQELAKAGEVTSSKDGAPLSEKSIGQAMNSASNFLKRTILA